MNFINSLHNPLVKHFVKLASSAKYRFACNKTLLFGAKIISQLSSRVKIDNYLFIDTPLPSVLRATRVTSEIIKKITGQPEPVDGIAEIFLPQNQDLKKTERLIVLDRIQDPGNVGTILRTAEGLGFNGAHLRDGCADPFHPKTVSASKGSVFTLPLSQGPLDLIGDLHQWYATDMVGDPLSTIKFEKPYALFFGNEGSGISPEIRLRSKLVAIPLHNQVESLNVAAVAAICCYWGER